MATTHPKSLELKRNWHLVDASGQVLGRLATAVARLLSGKDKAIYSHHVDAGDFVVVINAAKIQIKGNNKLDQKFDFRHSGYPGGETMTPYREFLKSKPDRAIELAISGMLPKNKLRSRRMRRLRVFVGSDHPHGAHFAAPSVEATAAA